MFTCRQPWVPMASRSSAFLMADSCPGPGQKGVLPEMQRTPQKPWQGSAVTADSLDILSGFCAVDEENAVGEKPALNCSLRLLTGHSCQARAAYLAANSQYPGGRLSLCLFIYQLSGKVFSQLRIPWGSRGVPSEVAGQASEWPFQSR